MKIKRQTNSKKINKGRSQVITTQASNNFCPVINFKNKHKNGPKNHTRGG